MGDHHVRTKVELAVLAILTLIGTVVVNVGQAEEPTRKEHNRADCTLCHAPVADITGEAAISPDLSRHCTSCHTDSTGTDDVLTFHASTDRKCTACHSYHQPEQIEAGATVFRIRFDRRSPQMVGCISCHGPGEDHRTISEGHKRAALLYHNDYGARSTLSPSQMCMSCHAEGRSIPRIAGEDLRVPQFKEHGDHPLGIEVKPGSGEPGNRIRFAIDSRLKLYDGKIECQTCHSLSAESKGRLRDFESFTDLCSGCHLME